VRYLLNNARRLAYLPVVGLTITTIATFVWALALTGQLVVDLVDGGWRDDALVIDLLVTIDTYLIAIVQLIVIIGLYELFIGELDDMPDWLEAGSLDDLKKSLVDVLIVFLAVKGIEKLLAADEPIDALTSVGAVAALVIALTWFRAMKSTGTGTPTKSA
jgi:uncharacterized membrane protein YqhA